MADSITISPNEQPLQSMRYDQLRALGLEHIQRLSGKIWSDNNAHDPGITILEVLAYAITDLGYRTNYDIKDLLTPNPVTTDIRNFFTAAQIMPNCPVTFTDYRKLLIDIECEETVGSDLLRYGVKNAWLQKTKTECDFYVDEKNKTLTFTNPNAAVQSAADRVPVLPVAVKPLYNVLVEFDTLDEAYGGDLNENTIEGQLVISGTGPTEFEALGGTVIDYVIEFPRWDTEGIEWYACDPTSALVTGNIKQNAVRITLSFSRLDDNIIVENYGLQTNGDFWISLNKRDATFTTPTLSQLNAANQFVADQLNAALYTSVNPVAAITRYQQKVQRVLKVLAKIKSELMENRNLCEDFVKVSAVKVEEIALCADIETAFDADLETVNAEICHRIAKFLNPTILFYSLSEMTDKGKTTDQIFDGPLLKHGFIDDAEMALADRRETLHVSDLISIIMDVPGVLAVKSIQVANFPLDNDTNIATKAVRWCLELAFKENYVPRLSLERSRLTFYKDQMPFRAKQTEVKALIDALEAAERPQKLHDVLLDYPVPTGEYKDAEDYYSIQEHFPLLYGISSAGLPGDATPERRGQANQLKAYLLFFEQLLANYLSQLFHVKDIFSMNDAIDPVTGIPVINKTYFSQSLLNIVPDAATLYFETDPSDHTAALQNITESAATYLERRNRVLDHLAARFAENFSDYALLVYSLDGKKAPVELIDDKLAFLNNYPLISSARDKGFNYRDCCELWHPDNISGLERRASYLTGINRPLLSNLVFSSGFQYNLPSGSGYTFEINASGVVLRGLETYATLDESKLALERAIINGAQNGRYIVKNTTGDIVRDIQAGDVCDSGADYTLELWCADEPLAAVVDTADPNYPPLPYGLYASTGNDITLLMNACRAELLGNVEANRYNLASSFMSYITVNTLPDVVNMNLLDVCPPDYDYNFQLNRTPSEVLLDGTVTGQTDDSLILQSEVEAEAQLNRDRLLFEMLQRGQYASNYIYDFSSPSVEVFRLQDRCGNNLAVSAESGFNDFIREDIDALGFDIVDSTFNNGSYTLAGASSQDSINPRWIKLQVNESIVTTVTDGFLYYSVAAGDPSAIVPDVVAVDIANKIITVNRPGFRRVLFPGEVFQVDGIDAIYTVVRMELNGVNTDIHVKEQPDAAIAAGDKIVYSKRMPVVKLEIDPNTLDRFVYVEPGADAAALQETAGWIRDKFFSHEGMHLLEHILLRPKCEATKWVDMRTNGYQFVLSSAPDGDLLVVLEYTGYTDRPARTIYVNGTDISANLSVMQAVRMQTLDQLIIFKGTVRSATYDAVNNRTAIEVHQEIPDGLNGMVFMYQHTLPIQSITSGNVINIPDVSPGQPSVTIASYIINSAIGNNGTYLLGGGGLTSIYGAQRLLVAADDFMPIRVDDPCEACNFTDPYSFIASVVLPAWQGRFANQTFRRFFERTLRLECPAHILLNICWVNYEQMAELELKYKTWLLEKAAGECGKTPDRFALSAAQNELIAMLNRLRSVYPQGTLHDCENDDELKNSIILNNSIIGTI
jgi:hypothetical protein